MSSSGRSGRSRMLLVVVGVIVVAVGAAVAVVAPWGDSDRGDDITAPAAADSDPDSDDDRDDDEEPPACDEGVARDPGVGDVGVVVSEIHYHPADGDGFVELVNTADAPADLTGWRIAGLDHCIADGTILAPGAVHVVDEGDAAGRLDNGGERLALIAPGGITIEEFEYDDRGDWPALADGHGSSLQRLDASAAATDPGNWVAGDPDPGVRAPDSPPMPVWSRVEHTVLPEPGAPVEVSATVTGDHGGTAELYYRVGFGDEIAITAEIGSDGAIVTSIPGAQAGELVRYRLVASSSAGVSGTWPRQGDGATYTGTTVADPTAAEDLVAIEWFMEDAEFDRAFDDRTVGSDETYPAVIAVRGEVFDSARIRVKGQSSRFFPKPKWKVELAPGQRLEIDGLIDRWVDEFALHAAYNDKSAIREVLSHEALSAAGVPVPDAFHVRMRLNGDFFGLYTYIEQPDRRWRDRVDLDDGVYEVGDRTNTTLLPEDAEVVGQDFDWKFQREAGDEETDEQLRTFLRELTEVSDPEFDATERREWFFDNVDVAGVVNALAVTALVQQEDLRTKNYRLAQIEDRWTLLPFDLDLTWGRLYGDGTCEALCDEVVVSPLPERLIANNTALVRPFAEDPVLSEMTRARIAVLRDELLDPSRVRADADSLIELIGEVAALEREAWETYGEQQSIADAVDELIDDFAIPQYERLGAPGAPYDVDDVVLGDPVDVVVERDGDLVRLVNRGDLPIDMSSYGVDDEIVVPGGVVLTPSLGVEIEDDGGVVRWFVSDG